MVILETEEQAEARVRAFRAHQALEQAPELVAHLRALVDAGDRQEPGIVLPRESTPLRTEIADDADTIYAQLLDWVGYWADVLEKRPPTAAVVAWRLQRDAGVQTAGFRAGTTPEGAAMLTRLQTVWLHLHAEWISAHPSGPTFEDDVTTLIRSMRGRHRLVPVREKPVHPRVCLTCREPEVGAVWSSAVVTDVVVSCGHCGQVYPVGSSADVIRELGLPAGRFSSACADGAHGQCESVWCGCTCHGERREQ